MGKRFEEYTSAELGAIAEAARSSLNRIVQNDKGYIFWTARYEKTLDSPYAVEQLWNDGHTTPTLFKDSEGEIWMFGSDETGKGKLTKLDKEVYKDLVFNPLVDFGESTKKGTHFEKYSLSTFKSPDLDLGPIYDNLSHHKAHVQNFHLSHFSKEVLDTKEGCAEEILKMQSFINSKQNKEDPDLNLREENSPKNLEEFIEDFLKIGLQFDANDVEKFGTPNETRNGTALLHLITALQNHGFSGTRDEHINFWSGGGGQARAKYAFNEISSEKVPCLAMMFDVIGILDAQFKIKIPEEITQVISKWYATNAKGDVNVYISSSKSKEGPGLTMGNNFWITELPTLQEKLKRGEIKSIKVSLYDHKINKQLGPYDINDPIVGPLLEITRRRAYQVDIEEYKNQLRKAPRPLSEDRIEHLAHLMRTIVEGENKAAFSRAHDAPLRPRIDLSKLRNIALTWSAKAADRTLEKAESAGVANQQLREQVQKKKTKQIIHSWQTHKGNKPKGEGDAEPSGENSKPNNSPT